MRKSPVIAALLASSCSAAWSYRSLVRDGRRSWPAAAGAGARSAGRAGEPTGRNGFRPAQSRASPLSQEITDTSDDARRTYPLWTALTGSAPTAECAHACHSGRGAGVGRRHGRSGRHLPGPRSVRVRCGHQADRRRRPHRVLCRRRHDLPAQLSKKLNLGPVVPQVGPHAPVSVAVAGVHPRPGVVTRA
jgi:hypothetical protein